MKTIAKEMQCQRRIAVACRPSGVWRRRRLPPQPLTIRRLRQPSRASRRPRDRQVQRQGSGRLSRNAAAVVPQGVRSALWRKPAPEGGTLRRWLGQRCGQRLSNFKARNSATTTSSICRQRGTWHRSSRSRCCAIIKHTNPCGTAVAHTLSEAYKRALECDPVSAFGGVIGVNRPIDRATATEMAKLFLEVIAAPRFDGAAREIFAAKKNLRLVEVVALEQKWVLKNVSGGVLLQDNDMRPLTEADLKVVSRRNRPSRRCATCCSRGRSAST